MIQRCLLSGLLLLHLLLFASACSEAPGPPLPDDNTQRYVDELDWIELAALEDVQGSAGQFNWIAAALSEQLEGRRMLLPFSNGQLQSGVADIQLEYDELPLQGQWSSPPGELNVLGDLARLDASVRYLLDPALAASGTNLEICTLRGMLLRGAAEAALQEALESRTGQPLQQDNPETSELWLLGRSSGSLRIQWEISGTLGGEAFSFTASQPLTAVSSYYEITILDPGEAADPARLSSRHFELLAGIH